MSQQHLFKDYDQATKEFTKKERTLTTGILVLINHVIYYFENQKEWETWKPELLKPDISQYILTNLAPWHEWLREREKFN